MRDKVDALIPLLDEHREKHSTEHYYAVPSQESGELSEVERAARRTRKAASVVGTQLTLF